MKRTGSTLQPTERMFAALDLLADAGDRALVRPYADWWMRESDYADAWLGRPHQNMKGSLTQGGFQGSQENPIVEIPGSVVNGLIERGLLKPVGRKRPVRSGAPSGRRHEYERAELTPAGLQLLADRIEQAQENCTALLGKVASVGAK